MNTKQLIQKFWSGDASIEDKKQLLNQLEIKDIELKEEFKNLFDKQSEDHLRKLSPEQKKRVYDNVVWLIHEQADRKKRSLLKTIIQIAACLLLITTAGWTIWKYQQDIENPIAAVLPLQKRIVNNTTGYYEHTLPDSSIVILSPHSSLTYNPNFSDSTRMLSLSGKGRFNVKKDKKRPFTVVTNGIATTALGTVFTIDALFDQKTNIHLIEGSIMVAPSTPHTDSFQKIVLQAGEQIVIDNATQQMEWKVRKTMRKNQNRASVKTEVVKITETRSKDSKLHFEKTNLKTVFTEIAQSRQVVIIYEGINLSQLTFTGAFNESESVENILNIICGLNEFEYRKEQSTYYVIKNKETLK